MATLAYRGVSASSTVAQSSHTGSWLYEESQFYLSPLNQLSAMFSS